MNTFTRFEPFSVGFERALKRLDRLSTETHGSPTYPPYNILKYSEDHYCIELAAAGFSEDDIDIEVKDSVLTVKASAKDENKDHVYIHRGIARRAFTRSFTLAETVEVQDASYGLDGILRITLVNVIPEHKKPRKIEIHRLLERKQAEPQLLTE